jgi:hypothetical protein
MSSNPLPDGPLSRSQVHNLVQPEHDEFGIAVPVIGKHPSPRDQVVSFYAEHNGEFVSYTWSASNDWVRNDNLGIPLDWVLSLEADSQPAEMADILFDEARYEQPDDAALTALPLEEQLDGPLGFPTLLNLPHRPLTRSTAYALHQLRDVFIRFTPVAVDDDYNVVAVVAAENDPSIGTPIASAYYDPDIEAWRLHNTGPTPTDPAVYTEDVIQAVQDTSLRAVPILNVEEFIEHVGLGGASPVSSVFRHHPTP